MYITITDQDVFYKGKKGTRKYLYELLPTVKPFGMTFQRRCIISSPKPYGKFFQELYDTSNLKNVNRNFDAIGFYDSTFGQNFYNVAEKRFFISAPNMGNVSNANIPPTRIAIFSFKSTKTNGTTYYSHGVFCLHGYDAVKQRWVLDKVDSNIVYDL